MKKMHAMYFNPTFPFFSASQVLPTSLNSTCFPLFKKQTKTKIKKYIQKHKNGNQSIQAKD